MPALNVPGIDVAPPDSVCRLCTSLGAEGWAGPATA